MEKHFCDICGREIKHKLFFKGKLNLDTGKKEEYIEMCTDCWRLLMIDVKEHQKKMLSEEDNYATIEEV